MSSPAASSSLTVEQESEEELERIKGELDSVMSSIDEQDAKGKVQFEALMAEYEEVASMLKENRRKREAAQEEHRLANQKAEEEIAKLKEEKAQVEKVIEENNVKFEEYQEQFPQLRLFYDAFVGLHSKKKEYEQLVQESGSSS